MLLSLVNKLCEAPEPPPRRGPLPATLDLELKALRVAGLGFRA